MSDHKLTNPKDVIGSSKLPLELVPDILMVEASTAFFEGAKKYGRYNWRVSGVRSSIYSAALLRHVFKWWNGEDADPTTRVKHLANAAACIGILLDAELSGDLTDDRPPAQPQLAERIDELKDVIAHLKELFKDHDPKQYTIDDTRLGGSSVEAAKSVHSDDLLPLITGKVIEVHADGTRTIYHVPNERPSVGVDAPDSGVWDRP
jgi:hypothetical protein